jgi:hypothetical protein
MRCSEHAPLSRELLPTTSAPRRFSAAPAPAARVAELEVVRPFHRLPSEPRCSSALMAFDQALFDAAETLYFAADIVVLFYVFPAYKRHKRRSLLLLFFASLLSAFVMFYDWTIGMRQLQETDYVILYSLRQVVSIAANILWVTGTLMFLRDFDLARLGRLPVLPSSSSNASSNEPMA